ncbi:MAG: energy transducer TonB [Bacteroidota bacterium]
MKKLFTLVLAGLSLFLSAQDADTTIYSVMSEMPRFPGCEQLDTTVQVKNQCAQTNLLLFFNQNIVYPAEAREQEIVGKVVLRFVVEKDGFISNPEIMRDIGGGCAEEAMRVLNGMNSALRTAGLAWTPGIREGKPVRARVTVPITFQLQDPPDFILINFRDTVYTVLDDSLQFEGGHEALELFVETQLRIPAGYQDSCDVGSMDLTLLTRPDGYVRVIDVADYWNLGKDYMWEAISAATETWGKWIPAKRNGREVPSAYDFTVTFLPDATTCQTEISNYEKANRLAEAGSKLFNEGNQEEGIANLSEAIQLFPENANFLYLRGQAYMSMEKMEEACTDFQAVRRIMAIDLVEQLVPLICQKN